ncbi:hypothetical protein Tco_0292692 [Tanacetum coccineum]
METIGIPPDKHETDENEEGKPLSSSKSSEVFAELFQKVICTDKAKNHKKTVKTGQARTRERKSTQEAGDSTTKGQKVKP